MSSLELVALILLLRQCVVTSHYQLLVTILRRISYLDALHLAEAAKRWIVVVEVLFEGPRLTELFHFLLYLSPVAYVLIKIWTILFGQIPFYFIFFFNQIPFYST